LLINEEEYGRKIWFVVYLNGVHLRVLWCKKFFDKGFDIQAKLYWDYGYVLYTAGFTRAADK
jgi:hypothetical protein